jgi:rSAM/selenodomain-associated transferase 2
VTATTSAAVKISVIIPTLNEAGILERTLRHVRRFCPHEIWIADGGSADSTLAVAREHGAHVLTSRPGRAEQMNAAAAKASGDVLLFHHADSYLELLGYESMMTAMASGRYVGGAFRLRIESEKWSLRAIGACANLRAKYLNLVYGDQAIFVRADVFRDMGGYPAVPICEDLDFFRRLRRRGKIVLLDATAVTSPRRWLREGVTFTTLRNILIAILFLLGFPPRYLSRIYLPVR